MITVFSKRVKYFKKVSWFTVSLAMADKEDLKKRLTPMQYHVTQERGTERAFTGKWYWFYFTFNEGTYDTRYLGHLESAVFSLKILSCDIFVMFSNILFYWNCVFYICWSKARKDTISYFRAGVKNLLYICGAQKHFCDPKVWEKQKNWYSIFLGEIWYKKEIGRTVKHVFQCRPRRPRKNINFWNKMVIQDFHFLAKFW